MTQAVAGIALIVGGAVFLIGAVNVLLAAAVAALIEAGIAAPWSSLIVAAVVGLLGWVLVAKGLGNLKVSRLAPTRTAEQIRRDAHLVKERVQ
jgi:phosphate/sulfate permease